MKKHSYILLMACAAIAGAALLCGCSKSEGGIRLSGPVQFGMVSRGGQTTKTVYGDDVEKDGKKYQRLDWVAGDKITIASPQALVQNDASENPARAADYVISQVLDAVAGDPQRKAKVSNDGANGLMYDEKYEGAYTFYGIYPKAEAGVISLTDAGAVSATIPASQTLGTTSTKSESKEYTVGEETTTLTVNYTVYAPNMKYAFMTAAETLTPVNEQQTIPLTFNPAFTAFEFNVSSQDEEEIDLTEFELVSPEKNDDYPGFVQDKLAGTFSMTAGDNSTVSVSSDAGSSIKVDLSSTDAINATHGLSFTVFTVPVTNQSPLRIRFTSKDGEPETEGGEQPTKTSYLDLKYSNNEAAGTNAGKAVQFLAGHKYRIHMLKLPSSQWKITIAPDFDEWIQAEEKIVIYI